MIESSTALFARRRRARFALAAAVVLELGCTGRRVATSDSPAVDFATMPDPTERRGPSSADGVEAVLAAARDTLGVSSPRLDGDAMPTDCSGYLHALYKRAHFDLFSEARPGDNGVRAIVRWVQRYGHLYRAQLAAPGDLVFFDNSYDRNGDGRLNDRLTHAGLVEQVLPDGTLLIVHALQEALVARTQAPEADVPRFEHLRQPRQGAIEDGSRSAQVEHHPHRDGRQRDRREDRVRGALVEGTLEAHQEATVSDVVHDVQHRNS